MTIEGLGSIGTDVEQPSTDTLGGGFILNSGLYPMTIDLAYLGETPKGAKSVTLHFKAADGSKKNFRNTIYLTSGKAKGQLHYYLGGKNKDKKIILPDRQKAEQLSQITTGKEFSKLETELKTIKLWNFDAKAEVPTEVEVVTELLNKQILLGVRKIHRNKRIQDANGKWEDGPEAETVNDLHRVYFPDGLSVGEKNKGVTEPTFVKTWKNKHSADYTEELFKVLPGATTLEDPAAAAETEAQTDSLFD
jgi:serine/threonine-protein kinase RIO1